MKLKKLLVMVMCFALLLSCLPTGVMAAYDYTNSTVLVQYNAESGKGVKDGDDTTLPTFSAEFRSKSNFATTLTATNVKELAVGSTFYLVMTATNFDNFVGNSTAKFANLSYKFQFNSELFSVVTKAAQLGNLLSNLANSPLYDSYAYTPSLTIGDGLLTFTYPAADSNDLYAMTSSEIMSIVEFKKEANPTGSSAASFSFYNLPVGSDKSTIGLTNLSLTFGNGLTYGYTYNSDSALQNYLVLDDSEVNVWPTVDTPSALQLTGTISGTQYVDAAPDTSAITAVNYTYSDKDPADASSDIEWYYVAEGTSVTAATDLTNKLPATWAASNAGNKYDIYAVSKSHSSTLTPVKAGTVTVSAVEINGITGITGLPESAIDGTKILTDELLDDLRVSVTYNNGDTASLTYTQLVSSGYALYRDDSASGSTNYVEVTNTLTYDGTRATNTIIVAKKGASGAEAPMFTATEPVDVLFNKLNIEKHADSALKTSYNTDEEFDLSGLAVTAWMDSEDKEDDGKKYSHTELHATSTGLLATLGSDYGITYYAVNPTTLNGVTGDAAVLAAVKAGTAITDDVTPVTSDMITGNYAIYAVVKNKDAETPVELATIGAKTIASVNVSGTDKDLEYGMDVEDALTHSTNGIIVTPTYDGDSAASAPFTSMDAISGAGLTMKIGDTVVTKDYVLTPDMTGKTIDFYVGATKVGSSTALSVALKKVHVSHVTSIADKTYNGKTDVTADIMTLVTGDLLTADSALATKIVPTGLTFTYADKNVGNGKTIKYDGTLAAAKATGADDADLTNFNSKYQLVLDSAAYDTSTKALLNLTGNITTRAMKIDPTKLPVDDVKVDATTGLTGSETEAVTAAMMDATSADDDLCTDDSGDYDNVIISYTWTYTSDDVQTDGYPDVDITGISYSGTDVGNYTITPAAGATGIIGKGEVTNLVLDGITMDATTLTDAVTKYTYPDLALNIGAVKANLNYQGASAPTPKTIAELVADSATIKVGGKTYADGMTLDYADEITVEISYKGQTASFTISAKGKTIAVDDIDWTVVKDYDGDTTVTGTEGSGDVSALIKSGDEVGVTATYVYTDKNAGTGNKTVNITGITLTGDDKDNYVLDKTSTSISDGTINQATQAAPAAPTYDAAVLKSTNGITVTAPVGTSAAGTTYMYSIDGGSTWQDSPEFTGLDRKQACVVVVKLKGDVNHLESAPSAATNVTTFEYKVTVLQTGSGSPITTVYTDDFTTGIDSDATVNSVLLGSAPANFVAYFSDLAGGTAQDYPLEADGDKNVTLYMQAAANRRPASGGGGGGSVTYKVTYVVGENGEFAEDSQTIESVKSGAAPDEAPTVTAKEGWEFVGWSIDGGETVVDLDTLKITKAVTLTAVYKEVEEKEPIEIVDGPIIDEQYTKPYATGYKDGSFAPNNQLTRAEMAAMIARLSYGDELPDGVYDATFADVSADAWYNKYIGYLESKGVMTGYKDGTFQPERPISRGEFAAVIARGQQYELTPVYGMFTDIEFDWAQDYITTLATLGVVTGYEDGTFMPLANLTRAEAVTMINRVLEDSVAVVTFTPNDIAGHWAEAEVILAVNERKLVSAE